MKMKRIFFITVVLAAMASATMSCGSIGGKKNVADTELDDSNGNGKNEKGRA